MALRDFWSNVLTAAKPLVVPQWIADAPPLDAEAIDRTLQGSTRWLTPRAVAGFDPNDYSFLADAERERLTKLVTNFLAAVSVVKPAAPVPPDAVEKARLLFRDIVMSLAFDRFGDPLALQLGKLIEREIAPDRPPDLAELRFNAGEDHSGDPGLWIWAFLSADVSETDEAFLATAQKLRDFLDPVARRASPDRWPYISFRSLAEQSEPVEAS